MCVSVTMVLCHSYIVVMLQCVGMVHIMVYFDVALQGEKWLILAGFVVLLILCTIAIIAATTAQTVWLSDGLSLWC